MSNQFDVGILVKVVDQATKEIGNIKNSLGGFSDSIKDMKPAFQSMAVSGTVAFGAIATAVGLSVNEAIKGESAFVRLEAILRTSRKASDAQVRAVVEQARALEKLGVVSESSIIVAQGQLATFDLETESIMALTPALLDYAVAEKGANVSTDELKSMTNGLAQALNGNFSALTRTGFVLDEATKELISNGTEAERVAAIVKVLNSTYKDHNAILRETTEGGMMALRNQMEQTLQVIGTAFLPIIKELTNALLPLLTHITEWIEKNPELTKNIILVTAAVTGLIALTGALGLLVLAFNPLALALSGIIAVLILVGTTAYKLWKDWDYFLEGMRLTVVGVWTNIKAFFASVWVDIKAIFQSSIDWITNKLSGLMGLINSVKAAASFISGGAGEAIYDATHRAGGGPVSAGSPYIVGENGPELFMPNVNGRIVPNGVGGIVVNINGGTYLSESVAEEIGDMIIGKLKLNMKF
jgi:hypothetical protein